MEGPLKGIVTALHLTDGPADEALSFHTSVDNKVAGLTGEMLEQKLCLQKALKSKTLVRNCWECLSWPAGLPGD